MKKILFLLSLLILPITMLCISAKAYNIDVSQLNNINLVNNMYQVPGASAYRIEINKEALPSNNAYLMVQLFNVNDLNTPLRYDGILSNFVYRVNGSGNNTNFTAYTNGSYGYRSASTMSLRTIDYIQFLTSSNTNINDYVFNVTYAYTSTNFINRFVPNTFYNVGGYNDRGYFQYFTTYLYLEGQQNAINPNNNTSDSMIQYNYISLNNYVSTIYTTQNSNSAYFYHLRVYFNNTPIKDIPNLNLSFLQLNNISINNTEYSYSTATSNYPWLYNNIVVYNDNATLFVSDNSKVGYENNTIQYIDFKLPDYAFKSSSYYQSSVGIEGYLKRVKITTLSVSTNQAYQEGLTFGYDSGYNSGYQDGYNSGVSSNSTSFDGLMFSIADVPMKIISSMLNFNLLGFNLLGFFMGIITLVLFIHIIRKFKE